jgi:hypothetical protein
MGDILCHDTLLFWFSLQGTCEGPKVVLFLFSYIDVPQVNTRGSSCFSKFSTFFMNSLLSFQVILFFFVLLLLFLFCATERLESSMLKCNRTYLLHRDFFFLFFFFT